MPGRFLNITAGKLILMTWKGEETANDIKEGKLSYSKNMPLLVSYFPDQRKYLIMDGHHRAMQLMKDGQTEFCCQIAEHQPKIYTIDYPTLTMKQFFKDNNI